MASKLLENAKNAVDLLYADTTADPRTTRQELNELEEHVMEKIVGIEDAVEQADAAGASSDD